MLCISDIRINNYVLFRNEIVRIREIIKDVSGEYILNFNNCTKSRMEHISPVKITEEWLHRLDFRETYRSEKIIRYERPEKFLKYDIDLCPDKSMEGLMVFGNHIGCTEVHQLQNIYQSLFGKEILHPEDYEIQKIIA